METACWVTTTRWDARSMWCTSTPASARKAVSVPSMFAGAIATTMPEIFTSSSIAHPCKRQTEVLGRREATPMLAEFAPRARLPAAEPQVLRSERDGSAEPWDECCVFFAPLVRRLAALGGTTPTAGPGMGKCALAYSGRGAWR